jgi:glycosyltransferase involved in cell wall biosynthesis
VTLHGYDINIDPKWWEAGHGGLAMRSYPARLLELAQRPLVHFVAVSNAIRLRAVSFGIPENKITVHYTGVDTSKFSPGGRPLIERDRRVLFIGRLVEKKGCEYLIRAFAKVQDTVPNALLVIVGDGPLREPLRKLTQKMRVHIQFLGALSSADVAKELALARVFILPSVTAKNGDAEGFGMVILEAQASGVPVVTSALGGAEEGISEGITGFAFRERDEKTLSAQIIRLLTDDTLAATFSAAGPRFVAERFELSQCTERLEALYDRLEAASEKTYDDKTQGRNVNCH